MKKISFIIPCYNSENTIDCVVSGIQKVCDQKYDYQIILSNDNSPDNVWTVIKTLCEKNERIVGISLSKNYGQQSARLATLPYITGEYVVFMDDDGQHPIEQLPQMVEKLEKGYDIVYASFKNKRASRLHTFGSDVNQKTMEWLMNKPKDVKMSSFFIARRFVVDALKKYHSSSPVLNGYFMQVTKNIANVEMDHQSRLEGKSGYNLKKLIHLWMNNVTSFSIQPLRLASYMGMIMAFASFLWAMSLVIQKLINPAIAVGYTSLIVTILFCSGLILLMLGLVGEYIGRMFITLNNVPQYTVKEMINTNRILETQEIDKGE